MYIYKITNLINNKIYIGQTIQTINKRWSQHKYNSKTGGGKLSRAIRKYGLENFEIDIIKEVSDFNELNKTEEILIKQYDSINSGYNIRPGGENSPRNIKTRKKMSKAKIGKSNPHVSKSNKKRKGEKRINKQKYFGNKNSRKSIICINNNKTYPSITKASEELGLSRRSIQHILKGNFEQVKGFSFKYV